MIFYITYIYKYSEQIFHMCCICICFVIEYVICMQMCI